LSKAGSLQFLHLFSILLCSKKTAEKEMLDGVMKTEGAERARYTYAYFAIKLGIKEINTDADEQDY
jgi:hypothetical protein